MKNRYFIFLSLFLLLGLCSRLSFADISNSNRFILRSASFENDGTFSHKQVFKGFGCDGDNLSPQLSWEGVPAEAKSLAITIYDPDAPTGSGWWHWTVFNIPIDTGSLSEGASGHLMPKGSIEGTTDFGSSGFGGACPPEKAQPHRYIVTLFALDVEKLDLDSNASGAMVGYFLNAHTLAKVSITGFYGR